jgi:hypothetical protein
MTVFFTPHPEWHGDLLVFRESADTLHHPFWARWVFWLLSLPPEPVAYVALSLVSIGLLYWATRTYQGRPWMVFTSFAFAWVLFYGQIDGLVLGGICLAWVALKTDRPVLVGAGIIMALIKPQLSLPVVVAIWWWSPHRLKSLIIPAIVLAATFIQWGWWIPSWISGLFATEDLVLLSRNISLWQLLGPAALLIWPIILILKVTQERKLLAIAAATALSMPYFPLPSAVLLLVFPVPIWAWALVQIPLLGSVVGFWVYRIGVVLPFALLLWIIWPQIVRSRSAMGLRRSTQ